MTPKRPAGEEPQGEIFQTELARFIDMKHALVKLAHAVDWAQFDRRFEPLYCADHGSPALPTRLLVGLHYLKYACDLSDEAVVAQWVENPYWQYFCGGRWFEHQAPLEASSLCRWRGRVKDAGAEAMLRETIQSGLKLGYVKASDLRRVNVDTTVQEKNIRHPTDARLYDRMRERLVKAARTNGVKLRQSYARVGKRALRRQGDHARRRQFKKAARETNRLKKYLARVTRDLQRKAPAPGEKLAALLALAGRLLRQQKHDQKKLYSVHEPQVQCIAKGKAHKKYEFGDKVSVATTARHNWVVGALDFPDNPYDAHTLPEALQQVARVTGVTLQQAACDQGYRGHTYAGPCRVEIVRRHRRGLPRRTLFWWDRRSAVEPKIGHLKSDHRLDRNRLKGELGDKLNVILAGCGSNLRKLLNGLLGWLHFRAARMGAWWRSRLLWPGLRPASIAPFPAGRCRHPGFIRPATLSGSLFLPRRPNAHFFSTD